MRIVLPSPAEALPAIYGNNRQKKMQRLKLTWIETGGPPVKQPTQRSFGTRLIARLADQMHGSARLKYEPGGLVYELDAPLGTDSNASPAT